MSAHYLLLDMAKERQAYLAREVAKNRGVKAAQRSQRPVSLARKLRLFLASSA